MADKDARSNRQYMVKIISGHIYCKYLIWISQKPKEEKANLNKQKNLAMFFVTKQVPKNRGNKIRKASYTSMLHRNS